jgi:aminoglycoside phosphotransferase (APT) family kinase protein
MNDILQAFRENIPALAHASDIRRIAEGFSPDQKYVVSYDDGTKLLLRTADLKQYERKYAEYGIMEAIQMYGAKSPQPIDIGRLEQSELCYYLPAISTEKMQEVPFPIAHRRSNTGSAGTPGRTLPNCISIPPPIRFPLGMNERRESTITM